MLLTHQLHTSLAAGHSWTAHLDPLCDGIQELARSTPPPRGFTWIPKETYPPDQRARNAKWLKHAPYDFQDLKAWREQVIYAAPVTTVINESCFNNIDQKALGNPNTPKVSAKMVAHYNDIDAQVHKLPAGAITRESVLQLTTKLRKERLGLQQEKQRQLALADVTDYCRQKDKAPAAALIAAAPPKAKRQRVSKDAPRPPEQDHRCPSCDKIFRGWKALNSHQRQGENYVDSLRAKSPFLFLR